VKTIASKATRAARIGAISVASWLVACRADHPEPAPAPTKFELLPAAPGALGARAAGTDAAPSPPTEQVEPRDPDDDEEDAAPDAGTVDAGSGVAL
jgi:hypothetical protein